MNKLKINYFQRRNVFIKSGKLILKKTNDEIKFACYFLFEYTKNKKFTLVFVKYIGAPHEFILIKYCFR